MKYTLFTKYDIEECISIVSSNIGLTAWQDKNGFVGNVHGNRFWIRYLKSSNFYRYTPPKFTADLVRTEHGTRIDGKFSTGSRLFEIFACIWFFIFGCVFFVSAILDTFLGTSTISGGNPVILIFFAPASVIGAIAMFRHGEKLRANDRKQILDLMHRTLKTEGSSPHLEEN